MKKWGLALLVICGLAACGLLSQSALAAPSYGPRGGPCNGWEKANFPYGFLCSADNQDTDNFYFNSPSNYAAGNSSTATAATLDNSGVDLKFSGHFKADDIPRTSPGGGKAKVLVWATVDMPTGISSAANVTTSPGGAGVRAPHCPNTSGSYPGVVYNYADPGGVDASPAAYTKSDGYESCGTDGYMFYWSDQDISAGQSSNYDFHINLNAGNGGNYICARMNISVYYGNDRGVFPGGTTTAPGGNVSQYDMQYTASHIAKQSERHCYVIKSGPPPGAPGSVNPQCTSAQVKNGNGAGTGTNYTTPGGKVYKTNTVVNIDNVTPRVSGGYTNAGGGYGDIIGYGASGTYYFTPQVQNFTVTTYLIYHNTNTGNWGKVPGSDTSYGVGPCYSAECQIYKIDATAPNNKVHHGDNFIAYALVWNDGPTPLRDGLAGIGNPLQLQTNGGDYNFAAHVDTLDQGGGTYYRYIAFRLTAPPTGTTSTIVAQMAYGGAFFMGNACSYQVDLYQKPTINISAAGGCFTINGTASSPEVPSQIITIYMYADGGAGPYVYYADGPGHTFSISVPSVYRNGSDHVFHLYAMDPWGSENGGPADVTMTGCSAFHIEPKSYNGALAPDAEDPTSFSAATRVDVTYENGWGGPAGGVPATVSTWYQKDGGNVTAPTPYPFSTFISRSGYVPPAYAINGGYVAGTKYCLLINAYYTDGFVDRNGYVFPGSYGNKTNGDGCDQVVNKPFFKVLGSNISAGGEFQSSANPTCSTPAGQGVLAGYYNNTYYGAYGYSFGSSAELTSQAMRQITGVASAQTSYNRSPTDLTFANDGAITNDEYDPILGGNFDTAGGNNCITAANLDDTKPSSGFGGSINTAMDGQYTSTGPTTINGGQVGVGKNVSVFADGDVAITNNITFAGSTGGGWSVVDGAKGTDTPSLVIHANGNIYIDSSVNILDGIYIAQKSGSKIYTCSSGFNPVATTASYFDTCQRQLTVHGSFVADSVNLMRTYGTMRDEKPTPVAPTSDEYNRPDPGFCFTENRNNPAYNPCGGMQCLTINEPGDTWWDDNALCLPVGSPYGILWSWNSSRPAGCTASSWPGPDSTGVWADNALCVNDPHVFLSANNLPAPKYKCVHMYDSSDAITGRTGGGAWVCTDLQTSSASLGGINVPTNLDCENNGNNNTGLGPYPNHSFTRSPAGMSAHSTCAAEVFDFSPELYLGKPSVKKDVKHPDALTSLPPVL